MKIKKKKKRMREAKGIVRSVQKGEKQESRLGTWVGVGESC